MKSMFRSFRPAPRAPPSSTPMQQPAPTYEAPPAMSGAMKDATVPLTVIELFQSQGCNSCPPANSNLLNLTCPPTQTLAPLPVEQTSNTLLLTYHVTYWDYLGWSDTFANRAFDERQREYVRKMGLRSAFTPQVIVNGRSSGVGSSKGDLARVLKEGGPGEVLPATVSVTGGEDSDEVVVTVHAPQQGNQRQLNVVVVWYDPSDRDVQIRRGENAGKTLPHRNVVKKVQSFWDVTTGEDKAFVIERRKDGLEGVVLVQEGLGGRIVGANRI